MNNFLCLLFIFFVAQNCCSHNHYENRRYSSDNEIDLLIESKPNVIFILVDDLGWNDLGYSGSKFYETPNIDSLSKESFQFTNAYSASPVCSPTRAAIMTGKHPARLNITNYIPGYDPKNRSLIGPQNLNNLPLKEITIAERLKEFGYKTFYVGKWHLGSDGYYPEDQGFDINVGGYEKGKPVGGYYSKYKNPKLSDGPDHEYLSDRLTNESIKLIGNNLSKPFALFLSFYNVHTPIHANFKYINLFDKKLSITDDSKVRTIKEGEAHSRINQTNSKYASMIYAVDKNIGKLILTLKENNLYDNSLIIFSSDNGGLTTQLKPEIAPTSAFPFRGGKGWLYEGGIKIPQLIKPPHSEKNIIIDEITSSYDLFPTILEFVGIKNEENIDGISLFPLFFGKSKLSREAIFWYFPHYHQSTSKPSSAIRFGDWKLVHCYETNSSELFNLSVDSSEINDLSTLFPKKKDFLLKKLNNFLSDTEAKKVSINPNYSSKTNSSKLLLLFLVIFLILVVSNFLYRIKNQ